MRINAPSWRSFFNSPPYRLLSLYRVVFSFPPLSFLPMVVAFFSPNPPSPIRPGIFLCRFFVGSPVPCPLLDRSRIFPSPFYPDFILRIDFHPFVFLVRSFLFSLLSLHHVLEPTDFFYLFFMLKVYFISFYLTPTPPSFALGF